MPTPKTGFAGLALDKDGTKSFAAIEFTTNQFVGTGNSPRFAVQNDEITYQRILGNLRFGLYCNTSPTAYALQDVVIDYGIVLTKGEYSDVDGSWTVVEADLPDPTQFVDDPDKWLFKNELVLNGSNGFIGGVGQAYNPAPRTMQSTDDQLPNGSWIDIKPRRKARYEEKLGIVYMINSSGDANGFDVFLNYNLRVLTSKWG